MFVMQSQIGSNQFMLSCVVDDISDLKISLQHLPSCNSQYFDQEAKELLQGVDATGKTRR